MEDVYNELDSVKAELEKLKAEFQIKTELSESLKKAHSEQLLKFEEAKLQIEKQSEELKAKCEEVAEARQLSGKLESCLQEKELSLRLLGSVNEKVKADFNLRLKTLEGEKRDLVIALDEVAARNKELEQDVCASKEQIEGLKRLLLVTKKECSEAEQISQRAKELGQRVEVIVNLEEEKTLVEDQLKWKTEKFKHLEEAHKRLKDQFQTSKEDWEREKSALIDETSSLEKRLDSQTRIVESLQMHLEMCNHALAHEESKRKSLEVQVSDFESRFENVFAQFQEEKVENQRPTVQRDEEIANLRSELGMNETVAKEMEFKILHLEQENQELVASLKELQEAQIRNGGSASSEKLNNKLRRLKQVHSNCSAKLIEKESELLTQIEKITGDVNSYKSELEGKEEEIKKLQMELEGSHSTIQLLNEDISFTLAVFKSELSEAYSKTRNVRDGMELYNKERKEKISLFTAQLETSTVLNNGFGEDEDSCKQMEESLLLEDGNTNIFEHEEENLICISQENVQKLEDLQRQIVVLEARLAVKAEEMEASLQAKENAAQTAKQKDICIDNLQNHISMLKQESRIRELEAATNARLDAERSFIEEKDMLVKSIDEKEQTITNLNVLATSLEQELTSAIISSFTDVVEKQVKIDSLTVALDRAKCAMDLEIEEKNKLIVHFEEVCSLRQKQEVEQLQGLMKTKNLEIENLMDEQRRMGSIIKQLEFHKGVLLQDISKLSNERENFLVYIQKVCDHIGKFSSEDGEMMKFLGNLLPRPEEETGPAMDLMGDDELYDSTAGENADTSFLATTKKLEASSDERSPLKEVNQWHV